MKVNTRSGEYAGKTNNCHLEASHTHTANIEFETMTRMSESLNGFTNVPGIEWDRTATQTNMPRQVVACL